MNMLARPVDVMAAGSLEKSPLPVNRYFRPALRMT